MIYIFHGVNRLCTIKIRTQRENKKKLIGMSYYMLMVLSLLIMCLNLLKDLTVRRFDRVIVLLVLSVILLILITRKSINMIKIILLAMPDLMLIVTWL